MRMGLALIFLLACVTARAASIDTLKAYLQQTTSGKARFAQIVVDKNLKQLQQATGTMQFVRPGRFRWEYDKPYEQTIVGDGAKLWIYDKDLNQVTVRKLAGAFGATMTTSRSARGTTCPKWMLKPCAKASAAPFFRLDSTSL